MNGFRWVDVDMNLIQSEESGRARTAKGTKWFKHSLIKAFLEWNRIRPVNWWRTDNPTSRWCEQSSSCVRGSEFRKNHYTLSLQEKKSTIWVSHRRLLCKSYYGMDKTGFLNVLWGSPFIGPREATPAMEIASGSLWRSDRTQVTPRNRRFRVGETCPSTPITPSNAFQ